MIGNWTLENNLLRGLPRGHAPSPARPGPVERLRQTRPPPSYITLSPICHKCHKRHVTKHQSVQHKQNNIIKGVMLGR